ncbi:hypothetical protein CFR71_09250 [Novacetimonas pomaceti]|uniref:Uncharacterized protein n=1 Tax=Novacetimonas pomaceti TaxID=2021998 RepID=A0A318QRT2_9PROT|nr:hypothetical protein CFR71_09250 [Novacetimonas pomaceti]
MMRSDTYAPSAGIWGHIAAVYIIAMALMVPSGNDSRSRMVMSRDGCDMCARYAVIHAWIAGVRVHTSMK